MVSIVSYTITHNHHMITLSLNEGLYIYISILIIQETMVSDQFKPTQYNAYLVEAKLRARLIQPRAIWVRTILH